MEKAHQNNEYLECEKRWVYWCLIAVAGWFGAYTYFLRGGVFCNAQTANIVLLSMALGKGDWKGAAYLLVPITAYFAGAFCSEYLGKTVKRMHFLRWDTLLIGLEILTVGVIGFLPGSVPHQITQITLNFICSMQFNTFRQIEGVPAATTFVTNHIRQVGSNLAKYVRHRDADSAKLVKTHGAMILFFFLGGVVSTVGCRLFSYCSVWGAGVILLVVFVRLVRADLSYEKNLLGRVPHGH